MTTKKLRQAMRRAESARTQPWQTAGVPNPNYARRKLTLSVKVARECSRNSWQEPENSSEFRRLKRAAMLDARAWRSRMAPQTQKPAVTLYRGREIERQDNVRAGVKGRYVVNGVQFVQLAHAKAWIDESLERSE